jgi:hypothetical protein
VAMVILSFSELIVARCQYFDKYHWSLSANNYLLSEMIYNDMSSDFSLYSCNVKLLNCNMENRIYEWFCLSLIHITINIKRFLHCQSIITVRSLETFEFYLNHF